MVTARVRDLIDDVRSRSTEADPGRAFFGFLGRIRQEAAAKHDLPDAIGIDGSRQDGLHAALDVLALADRLLTVLTDGLRPRP